MTNTLMKSKTTILFTGEAKSSYSFLPRYLENRDYTVIRRDFSDLTHINTRDVDLLLLECQPPVYPGMKIVHSIRNRFPKTELPIIVLHAPDTPDPEAIAHLLYMGVNEILYQSMKPQELFIRIEAQLKLKQVSERDIPALPFGFRENLPTMNMAMEEHNPLFNTKCRDFSITRREKEVILLAVKGLQNKEIADILNITCGTVGRHLENIYAKCNIQNRTELTFLFLSPVSKS